MQGTVVAVWAEGQTACMAVRVVEGGGAGPVEYVGRVPLADLAGLTPAQKRGALVAAVKAVRDGLRPPAGAGLPAVAGTVDI